MNFSFFIRLFLLISSCSRVGAQITLNPFPVTVEVGQTYTLSWVAEGNYTYSLWLVVDDAQDYGYDWSRVETLDVSTTFDTLNGSYEWTVPSNLTVIGYRDYALWINGFERPFNGAGFSNMTEWFGLPPVNGSATRSSATPSATASSTSSATQTPSSGASEGQSDATGHKMLSGGAIAGIVIGCLIAIALVIAAVLLFGWRKRRTGLQKREAAARANRLDPVMQGNSPDYEMHGRSPQIAKETAV